MFSQESSKTSPWTKINPKVIPWVLRWCTEFEYILCTQAGLGQLVSSDLNLVCVPLYAPERGMTKDAFLLKQARGTLHKILDPVELDIINKDDASPVQLVTSDIDGVLLNPSRFGAGDKKVVALRKNTEYNPHSSDTVYVAFTVEGAHSVSSTFDKAKITAADIIQNLDGLRKKYSIISLTLTHLEQYPLCNHAYGILFVSSEEFKPRGNRISAEGVTLVKACYERNILIDVKHMSLAARRHLFEVVLKDSYFDNKKQPIVCTHAGFTGLGYKDIPDYIEYKPEKKKPYSTILWTKPKNFEANTFTAFNPSSINLYDEDIIAILQSGGIIGLSLDKRILGYTAAPNHQETLNELAFEEEYISNEEKDVFLTKKTLGGKMDDRHCITYEEILQGGEVNPDAAYYHLCHFMSHILHLLLVAKRFNYPGDKALQQLCIGSDFDGIINPVWCCPTTESIAQFKNHFVSEFPFFAKANRDKIKLPEGFDIHEFANGLFFENGKNFLFDRLQKI